LPITFAVQSLVVQRRVVAEIGERGNAAKNFLGVLGMLAHLREFLGGKFPGFLQDGVRNRVSQYRGAEPLAAQLSIRSSFSRSSQSFPLLQRECVASTKSGLNQRPLRSLAASTASFLPRAIRNTPGVCAKLAMQA
jgi:hypothetical protein